MTHNGSIIIAILLDWIRDSLLINPVSPFGFFAECLNWILTGSWNPHCIIGLETQASPFSKIYA
jgi:hypothetical protein